MIRGPTGSGQFLIKEWNEKSKKEINRAKIYIPFGKFRRLEFKIARLDNRLSFTRMNNRQFNRTKQLLIYYQSLESSYLSGYRYTKETYNHYYKCVPHEDRLNSARELYLSNKELFIEKWIEEDTQEEYEDWIIDELYSCIFIGMADTLQVQLDEYIEYLFK